MGYGQFREAIRQVYDALASGNQDDDPSWIIPGRWLSDDALDWWNNAGS